jgi:hypothetical protein
MPATTPVLGLPYPVAADTADVPRDIQALAVKLDTFTSLRPPLVSSLPGSPVDGQECYYLADAVKGIVWHLRYRAASASAYKWEVLGGAALADEVMPAESTTSAAYTNLTTVGPQVTVPLAGDYDVTIGANIATPVTAGTNSSMSYAIGATAAVDVDRLRTSAPTANNTWNVGSRTRRKTGLAAATALVAKYKADAPTGYFEARVMAVLPVRVG